MLKDTQNKPLALSTFSTLNNITTRGHTDHETVDDVDIIPVSVRMYDSGLGWFSQSDPFIQTP